MYCTAYNVPRDDPVSKDIYHDHEPIMLPIWVETMAGMV